MSKTTKQLGAPLFIEGFQMVQEHKWVGGWVGAGEGRGGFELVVWEISKFTNKTIKLPSLIDRLPS